MKDELVSIITPSYNTGKYISKTIESVLSQTYENWEMIIVDDCSNDDTYKIVSKYLNDKRIKFYQNKENCGAAYSRNRALKIANGKWIAFLDSDDLWPKDKLEKQIKFMIDNNYNFSYTKYEEIDENSNKLNKMISGPKKITKINMYNYCWPGCLTVMYNKDKIGIVQIENLAKNNDYAMWLKIIKKTNCYLLNESLAYYRIRSNSISRNSKIKLIKYHYFLFKNGEHKNVFMSILLTIINLFFGLIKKIIYVKKVK